MKERSVQTSVRWALESAVDLTILGKETRPATNVDTVLWQPPDRGTLKINVDTAFLEYTGCGSTSLMIRDANGLLIRAHALWYQFAASAQVMKLYSIRDGIQIARDLGYTRILHRE